MRSYKQHFTHFLQHRPSRLHFAAHSHHFWPDVTLAAHTRGWMDAAEHHDSKWSTILSDVIPEAQRHIASRLNLPDPSTIVFAPNTHEFVLRLHSSLETPAHILTTDSEFHSFNRQQLRWQEAGLATVDVVSAEPFESFGERFLAAARAGQHSMVYLSQVFFNSGYVVEIARELAALLRVRETLLVIDGYHAFMALPMDLSAIADTAFFIAGGYKYAMAGEGACFMHCPPNKVPRPVNTGWFAGFSGLSEGVEQVSYAEDGQRFAGATFDASGIYRFNAVQRLLLDQEISVEDIHSHVKELQAQFLEGLGRHSVDLGPLVPGTSSPERGHFLTFRSDRANAFFEALEKREVTVDVRGDRLRFGFSIYQDPEDVAELLRRLDEC